MTLLHALRYLAVDRAAGYLLQDERFLADVGFEKAIEGTLGEQHGAREAFKVHAGFGLDQLQGFGFFLG